MQSPNITVEKLNKLVQSWQDLAPDKSFGGMTLAEFKTKVQPSLDARESITDAATKMVDATTRRQLSDAESQQLVQLVVSSIKGDPTVGNDSALYEAAGYVRKSERKSGLARKQKATQPSPAKAA